MKPGDIVHNGITKSGTPYFIRYIDYGDEVKLCNYINTLSDEHTFIRFQGEHMTLSDEKAYLENQLRKLGEKTVVHLLAFVGEELAGICQADRLDKTERHIANLGLSVAKPFRREGIGSKLFEIALSEASKHMDSLAIFTLGVFANNPVARRLYERFGFREYGIIPRGLLQDGSFIDHVFMYKPL